MRANVQVARLVTLVGLVNMYAGNADSLHTHYRYMVLTVERRPYCPRGLVYLVHLRVCLVEAQHLLDSPPTFWTFISIFLYYSDYARRANER